ncbi:MAG TPA: sugar phosphate isomerase/epimerase [Tepidisphaeraceae bacterium]|nr:sugar phosphate isomerase/epimerase [Tepidisphaeraceae bacterium]
MAYDDPASLPYALTAYGLPHVMGYIPTRDGRAHPAPLSPFGFLEQAARLGVSGVEFPLPAPDETTIARLRDALTEHRLAVVTDYMVIDHEDCDALRRYLRASAALGAKVVRATLSDILCGDRRPLGSPARWEARLLAVAARLREVLPLAQDLGLSIALENHQDAATCDFFRLFDEVGHHPAFGVCLDTGNPLAVGEDPVEAARKLAPLLRHVHLKDYTIHFAPEGYRLVRCAAGEGVIDFPAILKIIRDHAPNVLPGIEVAWEATRTIPVMDAGWWESHAPRRAEEFAKALRLLWAKGRPMNESYGSAWERGADSQTVSAEEWDLVRRSVAYFRGLTL